MVRHTLEWRGEEGRTGVGGEGKPYTPVGLLYGGIHLDFRYFTMYNMFMIKKILVGFGVLVIVLLWLAYAGASSERDRLKIKLDNCRTLAMKIDSLLAETNDDFINVSAVWMDVSNYHISEAKAINDLEAIVERAKRREFTYQNIIDLYELNCFQPS